MYDSCLGCVRSFNYLWALTMIVCETKRLIIQHIELSDAEYALKQLNEESFIRFIADKQVRNIVDAQKYLRDGPMTSYQKYGFGRNVVLLKKNGVQIGMCGLVKRDELEHPDLGYAFLPDYWGKGYAIEASEAIISDAVITQGLKVILGVTLPDNQASNYLLTRIGFTQKGSIELYGSDNNFYEYQAH